MLHFAWLSVQSRLVLRSAYFTYVRGNHHAISNCVLRAQRGLLALPRLLFGFLIFHRCMGESLFGFLRRLREFDNFKPANFLRLPSILALYRSLRLSPVRAHRESVWLGNLDWKSQWTGPSAPPTSTLQIASNHAPCETPRLYAEKWFHAKT